jgi:hypothetical protein
MFGLSGFTSTVRFDLTDTVFEQKDRGFMIFRGRARREDGEDVRKKIYESAHV